jgi:lysozyme
MKTGTKGIALIKKWEGCKLDAYVCEAGKNTIGYGNTFYENNKAVKLGDKITKERAEELLMNLLPKYEEVVNKKVSVPLTQNQYDALVSHTWNSGGSNTLFNLINTNAPKEDIRKWFETKYITGGGKVLQGLVNRRKDEADLFFTT